MAVNTSALRVWLVDDDASICMVLERALHNSGMAPRTFNSVQPVIEALRQESPDVLITDIRMPGQSGLQLLRDVRNTHPKLPVIVMTAHSDLINAVSSYKNGAFDYVPKPFDIDHVVALIRHAARSRSQEDGNTISVSAITPLLGSAPAMQSVFRGIGRLAHSSLPVLITGEAGTGKKLVARTLHHHSPRAEKPFITFNTAAIPGEALEYELFGYEGPDFSQPGCFEQADGGTLVLQEIADLPPPQQTRLLRVLSEGKLLRVGGRTASAIDVRIISTTRRNPQQIASQGLLSEDLLRALGTVRLDLPPLRHRQEDIPGLLDHYLKVAAAQLGAAPKTLTKEAAAVLKNHSWPGNVHELVTACTRLSALSPGNEIRMADLALGLSTPGKNAADMDWISALTSWAERRTTYGNNPLMSEALPLFERALVDCALKRTQGHRRAAAALLGWSRNTLTYKLKELGLDESDGPQET